jgi:hypothetical protein
MGKPLTHKPSSNTAAVITIAAVPGVAHELELLGFSYDGAPTGGNLKVESPSGTTLLELYVTSAGAGFVPLSGSCLKSTSVNAAMIITLAAGGSGVSGIVNAIQRQ